MNNNSEGRFNKTGYIRKQIIIIMKVKKSNFCMNKKNTMNNL